MGAGAKCPRKDGEDEREKAAEEAEARARVAALARENERLREVGRLADLELARVRAEEARLEADIAAKRILKARLMAENASSTATKKK
jgi:hypothetical protein